MKHLKIAVLLLLICSCAAKKLNPGAEKIAIVGDLLTKNCDFLGEVVGTQGNWWTDDVTSTKNKMVGSRNEMRNQALALGADTILILESRNTESALSFSVTNVTVIGNAYNCKDV